MSSTETPVAEPETGFDPAAGNCPNCGSHVLFTVELAWGATAGYRPDHFGVEPVQGDTITRCDDCGEFYVHVAERPEPAPVVPITTVGWSQPKPTTGTPPTPSTPPEPTTAEPPSSSTPPEPTTAAVPDPPTT